MLRYQPWRAIRSGCAAAKCTTRAPATPRKYATLVDLASYPKPGEQLHGFTLRRKKHVPELQLTALELQHDISGAEYLHVAREDKNNVFSIGFKTNPPDHTGVPHILEHTTLCGSKRSVDFNIWARKSLLTCSQVSNPRSIFQDAAPVTLQLHECLHVIRPYYLSFCHDKSSRL